MRIRVVAALSLILGLVALGAPSAAAAAVPLPSKDSFYTYSGSTPLSQIKPGTVLKTRTFTFAPSGVTTPYQGVQLLYRTTTELGKPTVTVTSVIQPLTPAIGLISDQFFYDALGSECDPSYYLKNNGSSGGGTNMIEGPNVATLLSQGYAVVTSDYEGTDLAWTAGRQSGMQTLDGIRAAFNSTDAGLPDSLKVGIVGYSGGAIASEWAAELAPKYAPDVDKKIVGTAIGGVYVYPAHNLRYVSGSPKWSGVTPGALLGVTRGFGVDLNTYASPLGKKLSAQASNACIDELLGKHPGLTFAQLVKPQYSNFEKVPAFVEINNALIMSSGGTPSAPLYIGQGNDTTGQEMTPNDQPGIGPGDGVMIDQDVRALADTYCRRGVSVDYNEFTGVGHTDAFVPFFTGAVPFLASRFAGVPATDDCAVTETMKRNSLAPLPTARASTSTTGTGSGSGGNGTSGGGTVSSPTRHTANDPDTAGARSVSASGAGSQGVADTGANPQGLLLWAALLICVGAVLFGAGQPVRPALVATPARRPRPGPGAPRRPQPHPRA